MKSNTDLRKQIAEALGFHWSDNTGMWMSPSNYEPNPGIRISDIEQLVQDHDKNVRDELVKALPQDKPPVPTIKRGDIFLGKPIEEKHQRMGYNSALADFKTIISEVYGDE